MIYHCRCTDWEKYFLKVLLRQHRRPGERVAETLLRRLGALPPGSARHRCQDGGGRTCRYVVRGSAEEITALRGCVRRCRNPGEPSVVTLIRALCPPLPGTRY